MEYDEKETELAKYLKNSTALRNLYKQCISYGLNNSGEEWTDWINAGDEFAKISGVGQRKLERYGEIFINVIRDY